MDSKAIWWLGRRLCQRNIVRRSRITSCYHNIRESVFVPIRNLLRTHTIYPDVLWSDGFPADGGDTSTNGDVAKYGGQDGDVAGAALRTKCKSWQSWFHRCAEDHVGSKTAAGGAFMNHRASMLFVFFLSFYLSIWAIRCILDTSPSIIIPILPRCFKTSVLTITYDLPTIHPRICIIWIPSIQSSSQSLQSSSFLFICIFPSSVHWLVIAFVATFFLIFGFTKVIIY